MHLDSRTAPLLLVLLAVSLTLAACSAAEPPAADSPVTLAGSWRAVLASPGGELPFTLEISETADGYSAVAVNGEERAPFSSVRQEGDEITLAQGWYDSSITARLGDDGRMTGEWRKTAAAGGVSTLGFEAERGTAPRFTPAGGLPSEGATGLTEVSGVWSVEFTDDSGSEPAQGEFHQAGSRVTGTFLTPTGDYRFLEGSYEAGRLRLSTFDGAHAFLFDAQATTDGTLQGDFWSRDSYHATWTAERTAVGETPLPDAWDLVGLTNDEGRFHFAFDDLDGQPFSSDDPSLDGKVVIANIFGSWCPNCNDKAPLLAEWHRRYQAEGLEIVGLAYEYSGDVERDRVYVRKFAERHGVEFPLLLAGTSDKQAAAETLPDLSAVIAFPTSVFIGRDGRVRKIHSGFSGPGTGEHYATLVAELEALIENLLAEAV